MAGRPLALVTRPEADAGDLAARLEALGIEPVIEPLLAIEPVPGKRLDTAGAQAILVTSRNGVRALAAATEDRATPVYAVGEQTALLAREAGFATVESADGDSTALARLAAARLDPAAGHLIHAAGEAVAGKLAETLSARGFTVSREVLYKAVPAETLSEEARGLIGGGRLAMVLFFSPRTAQTFVSLAERAGLAARCAAMTAVCLSPAVAGAVAPLPWRAVRTAERPETAALLEVVAAAMREEEQEPPRA